MPTLQQRTFALKPHPAMATGAARNIGGSLSRTRGELHVRYVLDGEMERLRVPERRTPRFADELWHHTCFEMFIACKGHAQYHELNFSPSGEWAAYAFARYRERLPLAAGEEPGELQPRVSVWRSDGRLELEAVVCLDRLSTRYVDAGIVIALSAVIETRDAAPDSHAYWALEHPLPKPDFHHPGAFALEFDEIRN